MSWVNRVINEKRSYTEYEVASATSEFQIGFEFKEGTSNLNITLDGKPVTDLGYVVDLINDQTIKLTPEVDSGVLRIERETDIDNSIHKFTAGALFEARTMDANFEQILHSQQELQDQQIYVEHRVIPVVDGLEEALAKADEASKAAQEAAEAAAEAAQLLRSSSNVDDDSGLNLQQMNNGLDSVAALKLLDPKIGSAVIVNSYYAGENRGGGRFKAIAKGAFVVDNVFTFESANGTKLWSRVDESIANVFSAGLSGDLSMTEAAKRFDVLIRKVKAVNLNNLVLKLDWLSVYDNTTITNGAIDVTGSSSSSSNPPRSPIMSGKALRSGSIDYESNLNYKALEEVNNVIFSHVTFKSDIQAFLLQKVSNILFNRCKGSWDKQALIKIVGGWHGTPLVNDTPTSYNLSDPINGRCNDLYFYGCDFKASYVTMEMAHPVHFVACGNVHINGGTVDSVLGYRVDIYNKDVYLDGVTYNNTSRQSLVDAAAGKVHADCLGLYIGQNTYNVFVTKCTFTNYVTKCFYIEAASHIYLSSVIAKCDPSISVASFLDIQGNYRNAENTYWGNCANINLDNVVATGSQYGIRCNTPDSKLAVKDLTIFNHSTIAVAASLPALALGGIENTQVLNSTLKGNIDFGTNVKGGAVKRSSITNSSNYAIFINNITAGLPLPVFVDTDISVGSGNVIYNNGGSSGGLLSITGGTVVSKSGGVIVQTGADPSPYHISGYKLPSGNYKLANQIVNLADNQTAVYEVAYAGVTAQSNVVCSVAGADELFTQYGITLSTVAVGGTDKVRVICRNVSGKAINFTATLRLEVSAKLYNNL